MILTLAILAVLGIGGPWLGVRVLSLGHVWTSADEAPPGRVALIMGAATINGQPSAYLQGRLDLALELWRQGKVMVFIVSGSISDNEPEVMRNYLVAHGVEGADIVLDEGGNDSYLSCLRAVERFGVDELTVVSQSYHVPRTVANCRLLGINAVGVGEERDPGHNWRRYERREIGANIKMFVDILTRRDSGAHGYDPAVQDALARHP